MAAGLGFKTFNTGDVLSAADVNGYLMQGVLVFADATARNAAITSPQEGQFAYLKDTNTTTYYTGSAWTNLDTTGMVNPMTTTGDTIYSSSGSTPARLGIGTAGQVLTVNSGATAPEWQTPAGGGAATYAIFRDLKSAGTAGGTFTSGAWRTRDINNTQSNGITGASIASNQITLAAGSYYIDANATAYNVASNQLRLQNITDSTTTILGICDYANANANTSLMGYFTISAQKTFELQHRCQTTASSIGFGVEPNPSFGTDCIYVMVSLAKVA